MPARSIITRMTLSRTSTWIASCLALAVCCPLPATSQGAIPAIVTKAAAQNDASMAGTVVNERHISIAVAAGPIHYSEDNDALVVVKDGAFAHLRYVRVVENGKTFSTQQLSTRDDETNRDLERGAGFFKQPYDHRYLQDYVYGAQLACKCTSDESEITFRSVIRDDQHGDGTMRIDNSTGRIVELTYAPNVLPNRASSGTTTETFGEVIPGVWTIVRIDRTYGGRVAFVKGNGHVAETLDHFRHFDNVESGLAFVRSYGR